MANYIKIPLAINPPRAMKTGSSNLTSSITTNSTDATNQAATDTPFTTNGSGTGATVQLTIAGNTVTVAGVTVGGEGFKVGDTLTFDKADIGGTTDVVITLNSFDLITVDGTETNEYYLFDVDSLISVDYQFGATPDMKLWTNATALSTGTTFVATKVELTFDTDPALDDGIAGEDLSKAIFKAIENPNSLPTVEFTNGVEIIEVTLN